MCLGAAGVVSLGIPGVSKPFKPLTGLFAGPASDVITYEVKRANLPVVVSERGTLESSKNEDAFCQVEGQTTIISIVPEGTKVKKGELVCELDSAALTDQLTNQEITTRGADASYQNAKLTREVAEIAVNEYKEGIFVQELQTAKGEIALAEADKKRAEDRLDWSNQMLKKGYVSVGQNLSEKLTLDRAGFSLEQAQTKLEVLTKYTKGKTVKELESEVEKARSDELAKEATFSLEKTKESKLRRQIKNCKIVAPNDGLVVYANDPGRGMGQQTPQIEEGATVRERQKIFSLPDITKMQVNTKIHESMIDRVTPGLRGRIKVDAFPDETLTGVVAEIKPLPDPSSWFSSDIKVYTSLITIEKVPNGVRPGMNAQVEILVTQLDNVLAVPVQAVLAYKGKDHIAVRGPEGKFEVRDATLGISNDKLVEVKTGLKAGDLVALNPASLMSEEEKREAFGSSSKDASKKEWGGGQTKVGQSPVAAKGTAGGAGGAGGAEGVDKAKAKAKGKGARGAGGGMPPAIREKMQKLAPEDRAKMFRGTPEERDAVMKSAGLTEDEIKQLDQMRANFGGGGGPPGGGGGGGFGGAPGGGGAGGGRP